MCNEYDTLAKDFLAGFTTKEKTSLHNQLLALENVHQLNCGITYYTFKNVKRAVCRHSERRKRTICYENQLQDKLIIYQSHEQHFLKNTYKIEIFLNTKQYNFDLVKSILCLLNSPDSYLSTSNYEAMA